MVLCLPFSPQFLPVLRTSADDDVIASESPAPTSNTPTHTGRIALCSSAMRSRSVDVGGPRGSLPVCSVYRHQPPVSPVCAHCFFGGVHPIVFPFIFFPILPVRKSTGSTYTVLSPVHPEIKAVDSSLLTPLRSAIPAQRGGIVNAISILFFEQEKKIHGPPC